jgi:hypothetical protein
MTSAEVTAFAGCSYRQLDYWVRAGRVPGQTPTTCKRPCGVDHEHVWPSPGWQREFTRAQAEWVRLFAALLRHGLNLDTAQAIANAALVEGLTTHPIGGGIDVVIPASLMPFPRIVAVGS